MHLGQRLFAVADMNLQLVAGFLDHRISAGVLIHENLVYLDLDIMDFLAPVIARLDIAYDLIALPVFAKVDFEALVDIDSPGGQKLHVGVKLGQHLGEGAATAQEQKHRRGGEDCAEVVEASYHLYVGSIVRTSSPHYKVR